ncbi:hypothetical protein H0H92_005793 [Tricholoma furcatifolium]|nr:hypothetical protein H0H92_005793 [Tricholoma furcatifolium]
MRYLLSATLFSLATLAFSSTFTRNQTATSGGTFGYTGVNGPLGWAGLGHGENALCSTGTQQSPINLDASIAPANFIPIISIPDGYNDFENLGTTVEVAPVVGTTQFGGKIYKLQQYHFHTPSEHRINGEHYPLEVHFVHSAAADPARCLDGSKLVLGAVFDFTPNNGATTSFVYKLARQVLQIINPGSTTRVFGLSVAQFTNLFRTSRLFQYSGSLTTPPCTESITWVVAQTPLPIDTSSYLNFKRVLKFNSRFTQNTPGQRNLIGVAVDEYPHQADQEAFVEQL